MKPENKNDWLLVLEWFRILREAPKEFIEEIVKLERAIRVAELTKGINE